MEEAFNKKSIDFDSLEAEKRNVKQNPIGQNQLNPKNETINSQSFVEHKLKSLLVLGFHNEWLHIANNSGVYYHLLGQIDFFYYNLSRILSIPL